MSGLPFHHLRGADAWGPLPQGGLGQDARGHVRLRHGAQEGVLEPPPLDAAQPGRAWHRVFADVVLPPGCALEIWTRAAEDQAALAEAPWIACEPLLRRPLRADLPLAAPLDPDADPLPGAETLEGWVGAPRGRLLGLRLRLQGTPRRGPALIGLRVTSPRPSPLELLPRFWRQADADGALERWLGLFEGELVALEARLAALPRLLDPATCPPDALPWLAGLLGLSLDPRLPEPARRQLLAEAAPLYRRRGTSPGLTRLLTLTLGCEVRLIEHFRLRGPDAPLAARLGPGLQLDAEGAEASLAHRYTVVVSCARSEEREALLEAALRFGAPAHALGRALWLDDGQALGVGSLLDLSFPLPMEAT